MQPYNNLNLTTIVDSMSLKYETLRERSFVLFSYWCGVHSVEPAPWRIDTDTHYCLPRVSCTDRWNGFSISVDSAKITLTCDGEIVIIDIKSGFTPIWGDDNFIFLERSNPNPQTLTSLFNTLSDPPLYCEYLHDIRSGYWWPVDTRILITLVGHLVLVFTYRNSLLVSTCITSTKLLSKCLTDMINMQFGFDSFPRYANLVKRYAIELLGQDNAARHQPACIYLCVLIGLVVKNQHVFQNMDSFREYAIDNQLHYSDWFSTVSRWRGRFLTKVARSAQFLAGLLLAKTTYKTKFGKLRILLGLTLSAHSVWMFSNDRKHYWSNKTITASCMPCGPKVLAPGNFCQYVPGSCTEPSCRAFVYAPCAYMYCTVPMNCEHNAYRAAATRQCADWKGKVCPKQFRVYSRYLNHVTLKVQNVNIIDSKVWAARFKSRKAIMYGDAVKNEDLIADKEVVLNFKAMIKTEVSLGKVTDGNTFNANYDPRFIVSTDPSMGAIIGPKIYTVSKILSAAWSKGGCSYADVTPFEGIHYTSGYNKTDLGQLFDETLEIVGQDCVIFIDDFSRMDGHIQDVHIKAENDMYDYLLHDEAFLRELTKMFVRKGVIVCNVQVILRCALFWRRKSGDMNTSVGNSKLNTDMHGFSFNHFFDFVDYLFQRRIVIWVMGDDFAMFIRNGTIMPTIRSYVAVMAQVGMEAKPRFVSPSEFQYCSNVFIPAKPHTIATQLPGRNLCKAYVSTHKYGTGAAESWVKQQSVSYRQDYGHVPFMNAYHNIIYDSCRNARSRSFVLDDDDRAEKHVSGAVYPSDETVHWLTERYGMPPTMPSSYADLESWLSSDFVEAVIRRDVSGEPTPINYEYATLDCKFDDNGGFETTRNPLFGLPKEVLDQFDDNCDPKVLKPVDLVPTVPPSNLPKSKPKTGTNAKRDKRDSKPKVLKGRKPPIVSNLGRKSLLADQLDAWSHSNEDSIVSDN